MLINITINNIQHINNFNIAIDANNHGLKCIVGKNGVGKTTLIKCFRNFSISDTFTKTSQEGIFSEGSSINYSVNGQDYNFEFDSSTKFLEFKGAIPAEDKDSVDVELPIPFGSRFNFFQSISSANGDIVKAIAFENYSHPEELISLLNSTYSTNKFSDLIEVESKGEKYYCLLIDRETGRYIREDYLSSGEFFLISLYRKVRSRKKLIIIDELDISLDAAAQVILIKNLRDYCRDYAVTIVFTTHSLALMRTLEDGELHYLDNNDGNLSIKEVSYNFVKSMLFGFEGWDKYILTEDEVLQNYIEYLISKYCHNIFYRYKIIYVGGGKNVVDLMVRNKEHKFLAEDENVICILDGDQEEFRHVRSHGNVYCIPQQSVEKELYKLYKDNHPDIPETKDIEKFLIGNDKGKALHSNLLRHKLMTNNSIHSLITKVNQQEVTSFSQCIVDFLCK